MTFLKQKSFVTLLALALIGCTEIYTPDINSGTQALVVEGMITDGNGPFTIKLSMAKPLPFDSINTSRFAVKGAVLKVTDNENHTFKLTEISTGDYRLPLTFKAKIGNWYKLFITTKDGYSYESNAETLIAPQSYDSIRSMYASENYINSKNELQNVVGADVRVDLFNKLSKNDSVPSCRFASDLTIQLQYTYRDRDLLGNEIMSYHWVVTSWKTLPLNTTENITEVKGATVNPFIKNHPIGFIPFEASSYGYVIPPPTIIYFLRTRQLTMNKDSHRFYKSTVGQLSASGKIFDPITSQVYGNMRCVSDASKIVVGLFEVSAIKNHAFVVKMDEASMKRKETSIEKVSFVEMPQGDEYQYRIWDYPKADAPKNDPTYTPIPLPIWWYHN